MSGDPTSHPFPRSPDISAQSGCHHQPNRDRRPHTGPSSPDDPADNATEAQARPSRSGPPDQEATKAQRQPRRSPRFADPGHGPASHLDSFVSEKPAVAEDGVRPVDGPATGDDAAGEAVCC
ncbi:predicted protein [Verticillium alfalfae VaMs.102]|uniref:Predicted protein n=1 Tax=Verticillium alfalfae (strain VaMs.102 / ATCC MYA-4576 / FGSC 10136) TaxID=526221 RepID=C9SGE2_VERA1|nr:predicted protein [Verticillium alfalfae VaMs.102]EEY17482.1 predicted protein [Verticillium alfalfae VaMs.102]